MHALSKSDDTIVIKFDAVSRLNKHLNDLLTAKSFAFDTARISRMATEFFNQPIFVTGEQTDTKRNENSIVRNILNDEKVEFPTDTDHISLSNTAEEIKQQSIDENKLFIETELKKIKRDVETLENLINGPKLNLIRTFTNPSDGMIVDDVVNVNDWINKSDNNKLDQDVQQNCNEIASEIICANNADLLCQMISNTEIGDPLTSEKITAQKDHESKQLAEKIQPDLDVFICDEHELSPLPVELTDESSFKRRRPKHLVELNKKSKIKRRSPRPYQKNNKK